MESFPPFVLNSGRNLNVTGENFRAVTQTGRLLQPWQKICQGAANFFLSAFVGHLPHREPQRFSTGGWNLALPLGCLARQHRPGETPAATAEAAAPLLSRRR